VEDDPFDNIDNRYIETDTSSETDTSDTSIIDVRVQSQLIEEKIQQQYIEK